MADHVSRNAARSVYGRSNSGTYGSQSPAIAMRSRSVHRRRSTGALLRTEDIRPEGVFPLAIRDLRDAFPGHLEGGVVDQDVERAQL
jgi:hypothetical protein